MSERDEMRKIWGFHPPLSSNRPATVDLCPGDKSPCRVGGDEPHYRCGTVQCGKKNGDGLAMFE